MKYAINPYKSETFDDQIKKSFNHRGFEASRYIVVSKVPPVFVEYGLDGDSVVVNRSTISKRHINKSGHLKSYDDWIKLANVLDIPVAVAGPINGAYRFFYNIGKDVPVVAVIEKKQAGRYSYLDLIKTAFYRRHNLEKDIESGYAKRINQPSVRRPQLPSVLPSSVGSIERINQP